MQKFSIEQLLKGQFGLEKESLRVNKNGIIVQTKHPLTNKFTHPHIKVDFGEQQVELISNIHSSIKDALNEISLLTKILYSQMSPHEYLWNYSMPLGPFTSKQIASSNFKKDHREIAYRQYLSQKTSIEMQLISGIHFNWSLAPEVAKKFTNQEINTFYFDIFLKYQKTSWIIKKLFGASPTKDFITFDKVSYRQSKVGYQSSIAYEQVTWNNYQDYCKYINHLVAKKVIKGWNENYGPIRTKPFNSARIEWLEIRNLDLDFTNPLGINANTLEFIHKFLLFLSQNNLTYEIDWILKNFLKWLKREQISYANIEHIINNYYQNVQVKPNVAQIIKTQKAIKQAAQEINYPELAKLELSTQILIKEAYLKGKKIKIINKNKNIIELENTMIEKATLNPFDDPNGLKIIDSKVLTNQFLAQNHFNHTQQSHFTSLKQALSSFNNFTNQKIVVKPVKANFSDGITIFDYPFNESQFAKAIKYAFKFDDEILIEKFVSGQEYRFLVINQQFVGALKRIPANVIGDGKSTINQLIVQKNKHPYRGVNYHLPLEKIVVDDIIKQYLKSQNLTLNSIIPLNKQIFLRQNSNISSGGDTIDVSDQISSSYQQLVIKIAQKLKLQVCGFDIIIPNLSDFENYTILELNWNPAIHIHTFPLIGKNRYPAKYIIEMVEKFAKKTH